MNIDSWDFFDTIHCISVRERQDRRRTAREEFAGVGLLERVEFLLVDRYSDNPEEGIYTSHLLCMEKGLAAGAETILIFEDDIRFRGFRDNGLRRACSGLAGYPDWNGLFLGCMVSGIHRTSIDSLVRIRYRCLTHGYAVSRRFAEKMVRIPWQGIPYDGVLRQQAGDFFGLHPMIAFQSNSPTDNRTLKIDRTRRLMGGLQRLQQWNEIYYSHRKAIIAGHLLAALLLAGLFRFFR